MTTYNAARIKENVKNSLVLLAPESLAPVCRGRASAVKRRKDQETEHRSQMKNV
jgi:hypothetical protein